MDERPAWSRRRKRTLVTLAASAVVLGGGGLLVTNQYGITAAFLGALCAFLFVAATLVFLAIPGPDTLGTLLRSSWVAGAALVVAVLLWLSTTGDLRWLWLAAAATAGAWTAFAVWETRKLDG